MSTFMDKAMSAAAGDAARTINAANREGRTICTEHIILEAIGVATEGLREQLAAKDRYIDSLEAELKQFRKETRNG